MIDTSEARICGYWFLLAPIITIAVYAINRSPTVVTAAHKPFEPTWKSLRNNRTPQWLRDGKFGIYTHLGVYCPRRWKGAAVSPV